MKHPICNPPPFEYFVSEIPVLFALLVGIILLFRYKPVFIIPLYLCFTYILHYLFDYAVLAWIYQMAWGYPNMLYWYLWMLSWRYYWLSVTAIFKLLLLSLTGHYELVLKLWYLGEDQMFLILFLIANYLLLLLVIIILLLFFLLIWFTNPFRK